MGVKVYNKCSQPKIFLSDRSKSCLPKEVHSQGNHLFIMTVSSDGVKEYASIIFTQWR